MATWHGEITELQGELIRNAPMFFVATADPAMMSGRNDEGPVNLSPKGRVPLHILNSRHVAYLDYTGSGNETARHIQADGPVTVMVCSFEEENAGVVRLYGTGSVSPLDTSPLASMLMQSPAPDLHLPERQVIEIHVEKTVTSCGYGVPVANDMRQRTLVNRGRRYKVGSSSSR